MHSDAELWEAYAEGREDEAAEHTALRPGSMRPLVVPFVLSSAIVIGGFVSLWTLIA